LALPWTVRYLGLAIVHDRYAFSLLLFERNLMSMDEPVSVVCLNRRNRSGAIPNCVYKNRELCWGIVSVRGTHGLSARPKPGTVAVLRPTQWWLLARECP
jgi:hypothetical protein